MRAYQFICPEVKASIPLLFSQLSKKSFSPRPCPVLLTRYCFISPKNESQFSSGRGLCPSGTTWQASENSDSVYPFESSSVAQVPSCRIPKSFCCPVGRICRHFSIPLFCIFRNTSRKRPEICRLNDRSARARCIPIDVHQFVFRFLPCRKCLGFFSNQWRPLQSSGKHSD